MLLSNKRAKSCQMIRERRLQPPVSVVLSTMQNRDQCDERRAHTSKPIFCTLLSHIKQPFNPFYLTMPAVLSPRELFHSDSVSEIFLKPSMASWFSCLLSLYTSSQSWPSPAGHLWTQQPWNKWVCTHSPWKRCAKDLWRKYPPQASLSESFLLNRTDKSTGLLKHVTGWSSTLLKLLDPRESVFEAPFHSKTMCWWSNNNHGKPRPWVILNPAGPDVLTGQQRSL